MDLHDSRNDPGYVTITDSDTLNKHICANALANKLSNTAVDSGVPPTRIEYTMLSKFKSIDGYLDDTVTGVRVAAFWVHCRKDASNHTYRNIRGTKFVDLMKAKEFPDMVPMIVYLNKAAGYIERLILGEDTPPVKYMYAFSKTIPQDVIDKEVNKKYQSDKKVFWDPKYKGEYGLTFQACQRSKGDRRPSHTPVFSIHRDKFSRVASVKEAEALYGKEIVIPDT